MATSAASLDAVALPTKVRFVLLPDHEQAERQKWLLAEQTLDDHESLVLQGWRQCKAVAGIRELLRSSGKASEPPDVFKWPLVLSEDAPVLLKTWSHSPTHLLNFREPFTILGIREQHALKVLGCSNQL